ncbi:hypothetical protein ACNO5E_14255 [Vibrio parahaemolyticus]|uniref:hypothetical protein n=1 Tax=Vibrio parahaemolyticus TaxID=670 RepID=UPI000812FDE7|nr:hypothetical protein [Vibrio parahaemolyticus]OCP68471.1 hypothetical protein AKH08_16815 [Vibrio parahaemolyticus]
MAHFMKIEKMVNPQNLIKPRVKLECRRFLPEGQKWTVICESGWPMDKPISVDRRLSKARARTIAANFLQSASL